MRKQRKDTVKGYKIDFTTNTIIMNYKFAAAATTDFGSPEYIRLQAIKADFPNMTTVVEAGRKITTTRPTKRLTYANMLTHIKTYRNSDDLIERFEIVKMQSQKLASPYKFVCDWFNIQFPNYKDVAVSLEETGMVMPLAATPDLSKYAQKETLYA